MFKHVFVDARQENLRISLKWCLISRRRQFVLICTRTRADTKCVSRFLVLGNCPSNALMSWLGAYLTDNDDVSLGLSCAYRLEDENYSVWIFKTVEHAQMALDRFHNHMKNMPCFVPKHLRLEQILVLDQIHGIPSSMKMM